MITKTKVNFIQNLEQKLYKIRANLAKAGYLHKDFLFNNI